MSKQVHGQCRDEGPPGFTFVSQSNLRSIVSLLINYSQINLLLYEERLLLHQTVKPGLTVFTCSHLDRSKENLVCCDLRKPNKL